MGLKEVTVIDDEYLKLLDEFTCGEEGLDSFLYDSACIHHNRGEGITTLIVDDDEKEIIAYYTLKCNALQHDDLNVPDRAQVIPAIEISRFAVKTNYQNDGWGTALLGTYVFKSIFDISNKIGVSCIMLYSLPEERNIHFYGKFGFEKFDSEIQNLIESNNTGCIGMYVSMNKLEKEYLSN